jgi:hypothetical protein
MKTSPLALAAVLGAAGSGIFVDAAEQLSATAGRSPPSQSLLAKLRTSLSNIKSVSQVSHLQQGHGDEISRSRRDDLKKSTNVASMVTVKKDFFSKEETAQIRLNENKYQRMPAVGFSGNRMWGGAYVSKSLLRRLVEEGGEQCPSEEYESNLPSGVHILTNHVTETTDPHTDYNPTTLESIENDVAIVFLNTNPDATLLVNGEYAADVEEGTLAIFPGGSVSHHIEIKEGKDGGFVHMFGPLEVGGSHGTVGQIGRNLSGWLFMGADDNYDQAEASLEMTWVTRMLEVEGSDEQDSASSSSNEQYGSNYITGKLVVTGYKDGTDHSGNTNTTLEVAYKLEGLGNLNCSDNKCLHAELEDQPDYCDAVEIGQSKNDETGDTGKIILQIRSLLGNVDEDGFIEGTEYFDIGEPVPYFFGKQVTLNSHNETILACSTFTKVKSDADAGAVSTSGAGKSFGAALLTFSVFVSSAFVLMTSL